MDVEEGGDYGAGLVGTTINGRYEVVSYLAKGGMGLVFEGRQLEPLQRRVAIKTLNAQRDDPLFRRRFFNEAAMCAALSHPNVVQVFDYGVTDDGLCYIVMEYLSGEPLSSVLRRERRLEPSLALQVAGDICSALMDAHAAGFVHRDLKPSNVMVVERPSRGLFVKVLDFGLAKRVQADTSITMTGTFLGSPAYMSPEQISGTDVGPETDIYNVGLLLYRMIAGVNPFKRDVVSATLVAQATHRPPPFSATRPDLPPIPETEWIIQQCLKKVPSKRFRTAEELAKAIEANQLLIAGKIEALPMRLEDGVLCLPAGISLPSQLQARILRPQRPSLVEDPSIATVAVATAIVVSSGTLVFAGAMGALLVVWIFF